MFTDAEGALVAWAKTRTATLTGLTHPLTNGLHISLRESPGAGTYGVVSRVTSGEEPGGMPYDTPSLSVSVWGPTKERAEKAARALANEIAGIRRAAVTTSAGDSLVILYGTGVTVLQSPDGPHPRYIVDAEFGIAPA